MLALGYYIASGMVVMKQRSGTFSSTGPTGPIEDTALIRLNMDVNPLENDYIIPNIGTGGDALSATNNTYVYSSPVADFYPHWSTNGYLIFNGAGSHVIIPANAALAITNAYTIAAVYANRRTLQYHNGAAYYNPLGYASENGVPNDGEMSFLLAQYKQSDAVWKEYAGMGNGTLLYANVDISVNPATTNEWMFACLTWDGDVLKFFNGDGTLFSTNNVAAGVYPWPNSTVPIQIGATAAWWSQSYSGDHYQREFLLFDYALSAADVATLKTNLFAVAPVIVDDSPTYTNDVNLILHLDFTNSACTNGSYANAVESLYPGFVTTQATAGKIALWTNNPATGRGAIKLDGSDDFFQTLPDTRFDLTNGWTIAFAYAKYEDIVPQTYTRVVKGNDAYAGGGYDNCTFYSYTTVQAQLGVKNRAGYERDGQYQSIMTPDIFNSDNLTNVWRTCIFTFDWNERSLKGYYNGNMFEYSTYDSWMYQCGYSPPVNTSGLWWAYSTAAITTKEWWGDVRIYDGPLTSNECNQLHIEMTNGLPDITP